MTNAGWVLALDEVADSQPEPLNLGVGEHVWHKLLLQPANG